MEHNLQLLATVLFVCLGHGLSQQACKVSGERFDEDDTFEYYSSKASFTCDYASSKLCCEEMNGTLALMKSFDQELILKKFLQYRGQSAHYIGATVDTRWSDGTEFNKLSKFKKDGNLRKKGNKFQKRCVTVGLSTSSVGLFWDDANCQRKLGFICQRNKNKIIQNVGNITTKRVPPTELNQDFFAYNFDIISLIIGFAVSVPLLVIAILISYRCGKSNRRCITTDALIKSA